MRTALWFICNCLFWMFWEGKEYIGKPMSLFDKIAVVCFLLFVNVNLLQDWKKEQAK